jgi:hypothetical protein
MTDISKQPPEDSTLYEDVDEDLDEQDATGEGFGQRDLEDEDRVSLLEGGIDDPDGSGPVEADDVEAGWEVDPVTADRRGGKQTGVAAEGDDEVGEDELIPDVEDDPELEVIDTDPADLEKIPEGYPNVDLDGQ